MSVEEMKELQRKVAEALCGVDGVDSVEAQNFTPGSNPEIYFEYTLLRSNNEEDDRTLSIAVQVSVI